MKTKTIKTKCIDGTELLVDIGVEMIPDGKEAEIFAVRRNKASNMTEALTISTLELPDNYNGIPITRISSLAFSEIRRNDYKIGKYFTPVQNLVIPDSIVKIEEGTFEFTEIYNVRWSSRCKQISIKTFYGSSLRTLTNTSNVEYICHSAFTNCEYLESIESELLTKCVSIGKEAFEGAINMTEFTWPSKCKDIPPSCFYSCKNLKELKNITNVKTIGEFALSNTGFQDFVLGEKCLFLGRSCFERCIYLKKFTFNDKCKTISNNCFAFCRELSEIHNTEYLQKIESAAFFHCKSLTNFIWPESCSTIPWNCFKESGMKGISISNAIINIERDAFKDSKIMEIDLSKAIVSRIDKSSFPIDVRIKYPFYN